MPAQPIWEYSLLVSFYPSTVLLKYAKYRSTVSVDKLLVRSCERLWLLASHRYMAYLSPLAQHAGDRL